MIRQISIENVRCGDVVLFRRQNRLLVHRIVKKRGSLNASQLFLQRRRPPDLRWRRPGAELLGRSDAHLRGGRRIDLDAPRQLALGLFISSLAAQPFLVSAGKIAAVVTRRAADDERAFTLLMLQVR